jgi:hypothetical protein
MTTVEKDFKVKNGIQVAGGGTFGAPVSVAEPTSPNHAVTKAYVDALTSGTPVGDTPPSDPSNGDQWFDTTVERLRFYYNGDWITIATSNDLQQIPDHIHDTAIDGTGRIVTIFWDGQSYDSPQINVLDGGTPSSTSWDVVFDGGLAVDNFN